MSKYIFERYRLLFSLIIVYVFLSFLIRLGLSVWAFKNIDSALSQIPAALAVGLAFDVLVALCFVAVYNLYLLLFPGKYAGGWFDKIVTYFILGFTLFIMYFGSMAEFPFWEEFGSRFNFIAVDYLIYTYEVMENINESYPLPLLIGGLLGIVVLTIFLLQKKKVMKATFSDKMPLLKRLPVSLVLFAVLYVLGFFLTNKKAEFSKNTVVNELAKNGIFSFFAAYRSNELDYASFYKTLPEATAYDIVKKELIQNNQQYTSFQNDVIERLTLSNVEPEVHPNIVLVTIESFSADFLSSFGNTNGLTPFYDSLAKESIFFTNLYATGTRTVRGMEALTLCVPPTPGNSIVRRPNNKNLFSIASVLKEKKYGLHFIYGGDGYFDNMNTFFGGQGFDIVDRDRGNPLSESVDTHRFNITDEEVSFENAWGICDEDIYKQSLKYADAEAKKGKPFFQFIMTTSNHKPYTFPNDKIDLPPGTRGSAVKYTDYALQQFIQKAKTRSWFHNTVFVIVADHCANSAGKWEINISKHHIPAIIYNLKPQPEVVSRLTSQIDLMPTLFGYLNWEYKNSFYGKDMNQTSIGADRAFIGNYRTLGLLKGNIFTQIDDRKRVVQYMWDKSSDNQKEITEQKNDTSINKTIAYYQTASERFKNGKMKVGKK